MGVLFLLVPLFALALIVMFRRDPDQSEVGELGPPIGGPYSVTEDAEGSSELSGGGPWTLWLVWLVAMVLGGVLWWAIGGTAALNRYTWGPAHWLQQGCDSGGADVLYAIAAVGLMGTGIRLMVKAVRRGHLFSDVGLWAGLVLFLDGLLLFWYSTLMANTRGCD